MATIAEYRLTLDKGSKKHKCPKCGKKRFVRYRDNETGQYLPDDIGRCDRALNCGYHKRPREAGSISLINSRYSSPVAQIRPKPSTHPSELLERSQGKYDANTLIQWLATLPGWDMIRARMVARLYRIGTGSKDVNGWCIFWQIDRAGKVRAGKLMRYDTTGHRIKEGYSQDWIHAKLIRAGQLKEYELVQCFFGLHIVDDKKPVAIVESEKTAIISSQYLPQFHWIAAGQLNGISEYKLRALAGRSVTLFPDIGAYDLWTEKANELGHITRIQVSDLLERKAPDRHKGYDLADYLVNFELHHFSGKSGKSYASTKPFIFPDQAPHGFNPYTGEVFDQRGYPADWDKIFISP